MEIRIKTHEELRADRVIIEIVGTGVKTDSEVSERALTQAEIEQYQTNEDMHLEQIGKLRGQVEELKAENQRLARQVCDFDRDRRTERERADRLKIELDEKLLKGHVCTGGCTENSHVAFVGRQALTDMERKVAELTRRIDNTRVLLKDPEVTKARDRVVSRLHVAMADAIGKALDTLG